MKTLNAWAQWTFDRAAERNAQLGAEPVNVQRLVEEAVFTRMVLHQRLDLLGVRFSTGFLPGNVLMWEFLRNEERGGN